MFKKALLFPFDTVTAILPSNPRYNDKLLSPAINLMRVVEWWPHIDLVLSSHICT